VYKAAIFAVFSYIVISFLFLRVSPASGYSNYDDPNMCRSQLDQRPVNSDRTFPVCNRRDNIRKRHAEESRQKGTDDEGTVRGDEGGAAG